ncbi:hypothetical protein IJT93_07340 [bacterium]|nr:hypothetical protein [bacterium]
MENVDLKSADSGNAYGGAFQNIGTDNLIGFMTTYMAAFPQRICGREFKLSPEMNEARCLSLKNLGADLHFGINEIERRSLNGEAADGTEKYLLIYADASEGEDFKNFMISACREFEQKALYIENGKAYSLDRDGIGEKLGDFDFNADSLGIYYGRLQEKEFSFEDKAVCLEKSGGFINMIDYIVYTARMSELRKAKDRLDFSCYEWRRAIQS